MISSIYVYRLKTDFSSELYSWDKIGSLCRFSSEQDGKYFCIRFLCFDEGNSLRTFVSGSFALVSAIPYIHLYQFICFYESNSLRTSVSCSSASAGVISYEILYQVPQLWRGFLCFGEGDSSYTSVSSSSTSARVIPYVVLY
ncbi:hypothetical protein GQ457_14G020560 [Hibiscus cannabinus]